jgi:hypothetical protein
MRNTLGIGLLILLLSGSAVAGEMPNLSPAPPPPSTQTSAVQEPTSATDEPTLDGIMPNLTPDSLTQTALDLLAVLSSLL